MKRIIQFVFYLNLIVLIYSCASPGSGSSSGSSGGGSGGGSGPDGELSLVKNLDVKELEDANKIKLEWDEVSGFDLLSDSYKLYRYKADLNNLSYSLDKVISSITNNSYEDESGIDLLINTPYFYKISYVKNGIEGEKSSSYMFGICTDIIDENEDKKTVYDMESDSVGSFPPFLGGWQTVVLYSCKDGDNGFLKDSDYFKYKGTVGDSSSNTNIVFEVELLSTPTSFNEIGDVKIKCLYKPSGSSAFIEYKDQNYIPGSTNYIDFSISGIKDVFFEVYVDNSYVNPVDTSGNYIDIVEKYRVKLKNES